MKNRGLHLFVLLATCVVGGLMLAPGQVRAQGDTFGGTVIDTQKWEVAAPGTSSVTQNDALFIANDGTAAEFSDTPGLAGPGTGVGSKCRLRGDFDIQVSFSSFAHPGVNFAQAFFNVYQDVNNQLHIKRIQGSSVNGIQTFARVGGATTQSGVGGNTSASGTLRILRTGNTIRTFDGATVNFSLTAFSGDVAVSLVLLGPPGYSVSVVYDDYIINSGGCVDSDGDGVPDVADICPGGDDNIDTDLDLVPDFCDLCPLDFDNDADGDGVCGDIDDCPGGDDNQNADGDSLADFCDVCPLDPQNDADGDGLCESDDNCPVVSNPDQSDIDMDGTGDLCDSDLDGDGVANENDNCEFDANPDQEDFDGDGAGDVCDTDVDGDGVPEVDDACVPTPAGEAVDANGCSISQLCPCEHPAGGSKWKNHGAYVSCVAHMSNSFLAGGLITDAEKEAIVSAAGESSCGQKDK